MNYIFLAKFVANLFVFFETADEDYMDIDASVDGESIIAEHIKTLTHDEVLKLCEAIRSVADEYKGEAHDMVKTMPEALGLIETDDDDD